MALLIRVDWRSTLVMGVATLALTPTVLSMMTGLPLLMRVLLLVS